MLGIPGTTVAFRAALSPRRLRFALAAKDLHPCSYNKNYKVATGPELGALLQLEDGIFEIFSFALLLLLAS